MPRSRRAVGGAAQVRAMRRQGKGLLDFGKKIFSLGKSVVSALKPTGLISKGAAAIPGIGSVVAPFLKAQGYGRPRRRRGGAMYRAQVIPSLRM